MDDALRIVVLGLEWFALWLERSPLQVAWPVLFALVFQVFLFVVHVLQWFSRGLFLRVACDYPVTTSKGALRHETWYAASQSCARESVT